MLGGYWRKRAIEAESRLAEMQTALDFATEAVQGMELRFKQRAALMSIVTEGRNLTFRFVRNDEIVSVTCLASMNINIPAIKKQLLEPVTTEGNE